MTKPRFNLGDKVQIIDSEDMKNYAPGRIDRVGFITWVEPGGQGPMRGYNVLILSGETVSLEEDDIRKCNWS